MLNTIIQILWLVQLILVIAATCSAGYEYYQEVKKSLKEEYKKEKED